ncbi:MAG: transaldolase [Acidimicrobiia bacterium]|nr:transaldolase [Acidimicrobiia bacterium]MDH5238709.1 transaldolase [Acidimicrobiia bacterium]
MTRLHQLFEQQGQSPWLDNLRRGWITSGELTRWVDDGVRGLTSNPSIFQKAIAGSSDYTEQFADLLASGASIEDTYWALVTTDIADALALLRPVYDASAGHDGFVSVEVDPGLAHDTAGTEAAARALASAIDQPNLYVKIPGTEAGLAAIATMIGEGRSINVTLLFSVERHRAVMEAYVAGLEAHDGDLSAISSVASFFVSRVDTEVDRRLEAIGSDEALALRGRVAVANAKLAYQAFLETFRGPRWDALAARGARVQRPLWASTSIKNEAYPDTLYVDSLIGPDTVNTLPDDTLAAFVDHGTVSRTIDVGVDEAQAVIDGCAAVGLDLNDVTAQLEHEGVSAFAKSFDELLGTLREEADRL